VSDLSAVAIARDCGAASETPATNAAAPTRAANLTFAITAPPFPAIAEVGWCRIYLRDKWTVNLAEPWRGWSKLRPQEPIPRRFRRVGRPAVKPEAGPELKRCRQ